MKRTITVILLLVLLLSSCIDASFDGSAEESSENTTETYIYAPVSIWCEKAERDGITIAEAGFYFVLCRVNCDTGNAVPVCTAEGCHHNTDGCIACGANVSDVTDDGKTLYFWDRLSENHDSENPDYEALIEYDTESLSYKELLRTEYNEMNNVMLAFGDGLVYNTVKTEISADGRETYEKSCWKLRPDGSSEQLAGENTQMTNFMSRSGDRCTIFDFIEHIYNIMDSRLVTVSQSHSPYGTVELSTDTDENGKYSLYAGVAGSGEKRLVFQSDSDGWYGFQTANYYVYALKKEDGNRNSFNRYDPATGESAFIADLTAECGKYGLTDLTGVSTNNPSPCYIMNEDIFLLTVQATDTATGNLGFFNLLLDAKEKTVIRVR